MESNYQQNKNFYVTYLSNWANHIIDNKLWKKYVDLHIDEIDQSFKKKEAWIESGLYFYNFLCEIVDNNNYTCVLFIPLSYSKKPMSTFEKEKLNVNNLTEEIDITPPSLGIFPKDNMDCIEIRTSSDYLQNLSNQTHYNVFLKQEKEDNEYFRIIYVTNNLGNVKE